MMRTRRNAGCEIALRKLHRGWNDDAGVNMQ